MAMITQSSILEEIAGFLAGRPTKEEILGFRPDEATLARFQELVEKNRNVRLSEEEEEELNEFEEAELLMQLVKAKTRLAEKKKQ